MKASLVVLLDLDIPLENLEVRDERTIRVGLCAPLSSSRRRPESTHICCRMPSGRYVLLKTAEAGKSSTLVLAFLASATSIIPPNLAGVARARS